MSSRLALSLTSRTQLFFLLIITLILSMLLMSHLPAANSQQKQADTKTSSSQQADNLTSEPSHWLVGSYYNTQNRMTGTLLLNNKGIQPLEVRPTLYNMAGQELVLPPVIVEPSSHRFINLSEWGRLGGKTFQQGSIKLFHYGKDLVLGAQIYLVDEAHSLSFEEKLVELGKFDSRRLEAVWAMPSRDTDVKVALSNTTNTPLSITARLTRSPHITNDAQTFDLQPRETRLLDLQHDFGDGEDNKRSEAIALSLEHTGAKEALLARAFISEADRGYSNLAQFSNPTLGKSKALHGAGLRLGTIAGERLMPVVVVRNTSNQTATLTGRVPYTRTDGTTGTVILPPTRLKLNQVGLLDMRQVARRSEVEAIEVAGLEIEYDTPAGSVIVAAHSESMSGNQVFRVPMWDVLAQRSPTGGYPWHIEETSTTKAYIKNVTDREQDYIAFLLYENGSRYMLGIKTVLPHQTIEIDVQALRDNQVPDEEGVTIPLYVSSGQLQWTLRRRDEPERRDDQLDKLALVGRSEQIDVMHGISSNYACQNCCAGTYLSGSIEPRDYEFDAGTVVEFQASEEGQTCYGYQYPTRVYPTNWSSTNELVAIVGSNSGIVTMLGAGTAEIKASWSVERSYENYPCGGGSYFTASTDGETIVAGSQQEAARAIDIQPSIAACGTCVMNYTQTRPKAGLTVRPRPTIIGINDVWYFGGLTPAFYVQTQTLNATPNNASSYEWTIVQGSDHATFTGGVSTIVTSTNLVDLIPTGKSNSARDVGIRVKVNGATSQTFGVSVHALDRLTAGAIEDLASSTYGYETHVNYGVKDNFGNAPPYDIEINEHFPLPKTNDYPGVNWQVGPAGAITVAAGGGGLFYDRLAPPLLSQGPTPIPVSPESPLSGIKIFHLDQQWRAGSSSIGVGYPMQLDVIQLYLDHGRHLSIVTPVP